MLKTRAHLNYRFYESPDSLVYVIKGHKQYKIGYSTHFEKRLAELQIGNEYPLTIVALINTPHPRKLEARLQSQFRKKQRLGEWFALSDKDIAAIQKGAYETVL